MHGRSLIFSHTFSPVTGFQQFSPWNSVSDPLHMCVFFYLFVFAIGSLFFSNNSHKEYQNPLMWYSSTTLISFMGRTPLITAKYNFDAK